MTTTTYISEPYDRSAIIGALLKLRPEISLSNPKVHVGDVEVPAPTAGQGKVISITLNFALSDEEWRQVLEASRI